MLNKYVLGIASYPSIMFKGCFRDVLVMIKSGVGYALGMLGDVGVCLGECFGNVFVMLGNYKWVHRSHSLNIFPLSA